MTDRQAIPLCHCNLPLTPTLCATCGLWDGPTRIEHNYAEVSDETMAEVNAAPCPNADVSNEPWITHTTCSLCAEPTTGANTEQEQSLRAVLKEFEDGYCDEKIVIEAAVRHANHCNADQHAECRAEVAKLRADVAMLEGFRNGWMEQVARLNERIAELMEYARHQAGCSADLDDQYRCRCGFKELEARNE